MTLTIAGSYETGFNSQMEVVRHKGDICNRNINLILSSDQELLYSQGSTNEDQVFLFLAPPPLLTFVLRSQNYRTDKSHVLFWKSMTFPSAFLFP